MTISISNKSHTKKPEKKQKMFYTSFDAKSHAFHSFMDHVYRSTASSSCFLRRSNSLSLSLFSILCLNSARPPHSFECSDRELESNRIEFTRTRDCSFSDVGSGEEAAEAVVMIELLHFWSQLERQSIGRKKRQQRVRQDLHEKKKHELDGIYLLM